MILQILAAIHSGAFTLKLQCLTFFALSISPVVWCFEKLANWHLANGDYVHFVLGAIIVDHLVGSAYHAFWLRDFTWKMNARGLMIKLFMVVTVGYLFEGLNMLMVEESILVDYTIMVLRLIVFLYPAGSAFGNAYEMTGRVFPPVGFMNKLKQFNENASINSLNKTVKDEEE